MKRSISVLVAMILTAAALYACEFTYLLTDSAGSTITITPKSTTILDFGETYTLTMLFHEDHRNCKVPPEDTMVLLDQARWRPGSTTQALALQSAVSWVQDGSRDNTGTIVFTATGSGEHTVEVIRECTRGGYTAKLVFVIDEPTGESS